MKPRIKAIRTALALSALVAALAACSPHYNWRESSDNGAHFVVLLPAKPASATRPVSLGEVQVDMTMTAAEVDGVVFAVGTAELPATADGDAALQAMQRALLANITGQEQAPPALGGATAGWSRYRDVDARGSARGQAMRLVARLGLRERRLYQVMVMGPAERIGDEQIETFFGSFKPI